MHVTTCTRADYKTSAEGSYHGGFGCEPCGYVLYYEQHIASLPGARAGGANVHRRAALGAAAHPKAGTWVHEERIYGHYSTTRALAIHNAHADRAARLKADALAVNPAYAAYEAARAAALGEEADAQSTEIYLTDLEASQFPSCSAEFDGCVAECRDALTDAMAQCVREADGTVGSSGTCSTARHAVMRGACAGTHAEETCVIPTMKQFRALWNIPDRANNDDNASAGGSSSDASPELTQQDDAAALGNSATDAVTDEERGDSKHIRASSWKLWR